MHLSRRIRNFFCHAGQNFSEEWIKDNKLMKTKMLASTLLSLGVVLALAAILPVQLTFGTPKASPLRYRLIDMGTLGGPASHQSVNGPEDQIINDAGVVGFTGDTAVPDPFVPCFWPDCFLSHATRWENGVLTDLGALPGFGNSSASAGINALGWITGESENGEIDPFSGLPEIRSVLLAERRADRPGNFGRA